METPTYYYILLLEIETSTYYDIIILELETPISYCIIILEIKTCTLRSTADALESQTFQRAVSCMPGHLCMPKEVA